MSDTSYKPESECSQEELITWRWFRAGIAAMTGAAVAAAVLGVLALVSDFCGWQAFGVTCGICAAACGLAARFFINIPSPEMQQLMRNIRAAGGTPAGERMIEIWK